MMDHVPLSGGTPKGPADRLCEELQSLKSSSGLTYARISERTHYAKSSWERWVNGKQFPPRDAVERIAAVCQADERRLLELWTLAEACRTPAAAPGAAPGAAGCGGAPGEGDAASPDRRQTVLLLLTVLALALTAGLARSVALRRELRRDTLSGGGV
ncbi:helix-turn-helix transcriptional regulator [Kitasatospora sp. NPDC004723]|uniref:helix-turn-helix domain-containing protein n=1 Tax=Kitasatospora sp. NPDC004723 TaxID=3154288 RepID=UPI0033B511BF